MVGVEKSLYRPGVSGSAMLLTALMLVSPAMLRPVVAGSADPDRDGLTTAFETNRSQTNPNVGDTDHDGIPDGAEDPDGDLLSNASEQRFGSDPRVADSDSDGTNDWHEDADHDGRSNGLEQDQRRVPSDLAPPLAHAADDRPIHYRDGCHLLHGYTTPWVCVYGDRSGDKTIVLLGDSHAAQWLPALIEIAKRRSWRVVPVTKSGCPSASVTPIYKGSPDAECTVWRRKAFDLIKSLHPSLVLAASYGGYALSRPAGTTKEDAWRQGWVRSLRRLSSIALHVAVLEDTFKPLVDPVECLSKHSSNMSFCSTLRSRSINQMALRVTKHSTTQAGVPFIATMSLTCPYDPCPAVIGHWLVDHDRGHLTATFSRHIGPGLEKLLPAPFGPGP